MTVLIRFAALFIMASVIAACAGPQVKKEDYAEYPEGKPRSILIPPVVNNTVNVDAPRYFLSSIPIPVADHGYYIFPVNLVRGVMNEEGLSDANMVHAADPTILGALFGADAILYITIDQWETQYLLVSSTTIVSFTYVLKSGRTGEELWRGSATMRESSEDNVKESSEQSGGDTWLGNLIEQAVSAAVQRMAPDYMPLVREANRQALRERGEAFPDGPYSARYGGY